MPITAVPDEYAARIRANGDDPDQFVFDTETRRATRKPATSNQMLRSFVQGVGRDTFGAPAKYIGEASDAALRKMHGTDELPPSAPGMALGPDAPFRAGKTLGELGELVNRASDKYNVTDQEAGKLPNMIARGAGNVAGMLMPAGALLKLGAAPRAVTAGVSALGGLQGAEAARDLAEKGGKSKDEAVLRGIPAGALTALIEKFLSTGRLAKMLGEAASAKGALATGATEAGIGAVGGAAQQGVVDLAGQGKVVPENLGPAALVGGTVQGATAGIAQALRGKGPAGTVAAGDDSYKAVQDLIDSEAAAGSGQPAVAGTEPLANLKPARQLSDSEVDTLLAMSEEQLANIPDPSHADKALAKARKSNVTLSRERIDSLYKTADKDAAADTVRGWYMEDQAKALRKPKSAEESAAAMQKRMQEALVEFNENTKAIEKTKTELSKAVKNVDKMKSQPAGARWAEKARIVTSFQQQIAAQEAALMQGLKDKYPDVLQSVIDEYKKAEIAKRKPVQGPPLTATPAQTPPVEGEQSVPFTAAGSRNNPPVPEPANVVAAQLAATANPNSSKAATLVTPNSASPGTDLPTVTTPEGTVAYNPDKTSAEQAAATTTADNATGLGLSQDAPRSSANSASPDNPVVTASTTDAANVSAEVVSDPKGINAAAQAAQAAHPNADVQVKSAEDVAADRIGPQEYYGIFGPTPQMIAGLNKTLKDKYGFTLDPASMLEAVSRGVSASLARIDAGGALFRHISNDLFTTKNKRFIRDLRAAQALKPAWSRPEFVRWVHDSLDNQNWNFGALPRDLQQAGQLTAKMLKALSAEQRRLNIGVLDNGVVRPIKDIEGYFPFAIDRDVWDAATKNLPSWAGYRKDFIDNWTKQFGANTTHAAEAALQDIFGGLGGAGTGQPTYSAVRIAHGINLPQSWRSKDLYQSFVRYAGRRAADLAWGTKIQQNPYMRRYFGIGEDTMGNKTRKTDPTSINLNSPEGQLAIREGERVDADWVKRGDLTINPMFDKNKYDTIISSFTGRPVRGSTKGQRAYESGQQLAGSILQQTGAGYRNLKQGVGSLGEYVSVKDMVPVVRGLIDSIKSPLKTIDESKKAGAQPESNIDAEVADVLSNAVYKTAKGLRKATGHNFMEEYAKGLIWNVTKHVVEYHQAKGVDSPLAKEFGPVGKSAAETALETANNLVNRAMPTYDYRSLSPSFVPQNSTVFNALFGLLRFSLARYNNWYEDVWMPAKKGNYGRLIKSLGFGTLNAAVTTEVLKFVLGQTPQHLTIPEWLGLDDDKKMEELAPMLFAYNQTQGTLGYLGDIAAYGVNFATGKDLNPPDASPRTAAAIIGYDAISLGANFVNYALTYGADAGDFGDFLLELGRLNQSGRALDYLFQSDTYKQRLSNRNERLYESIYRKSAQTGEPLGPPSSSFGGSRKPFTLEKRLNESRNYSRLAPALAERSLSGVQLPRIKDPVRELDFYEKIMRMNGTGADMLEYDLNKSIQNQDRKRFVEMFK